MAEWHIYRKDAEVPHDDIVAQGRLPDPPTWRDFRARRTRQTRGMNYKPSDYEVDMVNASLYLRRPLLITGNPGSGKSSLAYAVAWQLNLGSVLWWPINSRSTLQEGLYNYDALGRLRDLNIEKIESEQQKLKGGDKSVKQPSAAERMGRYIRLGPLGTALYGGPKPRVLLIDEIDKSDIDLPNDLLHVLEEGVFDIPELQRLTPENYGDEARAAGPDQDASITVNVYPHDKDRQSRMIPITDGRVECDRFPFIVLTSNGERELPPAFKRRCLNLDIEDPKGDRLREIVTAHIEEARAAGGADAAAKPDASLQGFDLQLTSWGDGSGVPTSSNNLVLIGVDDSNLLHLRIFDAGGKLIVDAEESSVSRAQAGPVSILKKQLLSLPRPHVLTDFEKEQFIGHAASIAAQTPLPEVEGLIAKFEAERRDSSSLLATDQLLNAVYLITRKRAPTGDERAQILKTVLRELGKR